LPREDLFLVELDPMEDMQDSNLESEALIRSVNAAFEQFAKLQKKIPQEVVLSVSSLDKPGQLADTVVGHLPLKLEDKQRLLETIDPNRRLEKLYELMRARSRSCRSSSASRAGSSARWKRPSASTISTSRCAPSKRRWAKKTTSKARSRSLKKSSRKSACPATRPRRSARS
jgi:hypothetical protein